MALFAAVFIFLGYLGYRKTKTAEDYFIAGGKMGPLIIAFSYGATFISAVALIGFSGIASVYGHSILWLAFLNIFVGIFIAFVVYGLRTRKMGLSLKAMTLPELLGNRFNSVKLQQTSGLIIGIFMVAYTSAVFLAIASLFQVTFGIPYWLCVVIFTLDCRYLSDHWWFVCGDVDACGASNCDVSRHDHSYCWYLCDVRRYRPCA